MTYHRSKCELAPSNGPVLEKIDEHNRKYSNYLGQMDDTVFKQELDIYIQSFDLVVIANPIISTMHIFVTSAKDFLDRYLAMAPTTPYKLNNTQNSLDYIKVWPIVSIKCSDIRLIAPSQQTIAVESDEIVLLLHFQSISFTSVPVNPIKKVVVNRSLYKMLKELYREPLKKLKLWNVQYQLNINNVGLCTTNWESIQATISEDQYLTGGQNPALEWNNQSGYFIIILNVIIFERIK